jgi:glycosyltransferase involved in cell wall biosynthesis
MKYSIIIPAFNEAGFIENAVEALNKQTVDRESFEIVVVDNNSTDDTSAIAAAAGADKVVLETEPGTNIARQRGVVESAGEIVAFLDADCIPPSDWLEQIGKHLSNQDIKAVSGPCDMQFRGIYRMIEVLYTRYIFSNLDRMLHFVFRKKAGVIMGGNFAAHRETIDAIGGLPRYKFHGDDSAVAMHISRKLGKVMFSRHFRVYSSPRRFKSEGPLWLTLKYAWYYLKNYFFLKAQP